MNNYKELKIWQKAVDLAVDIYSVTTHFPQSEIYGLTSQIRRSSVSIPSNIAEGSGRNSRKDFGYFLGVSHGSSCELETQLIIANRVGLLEKSELESLTQTLIEVQKMNRALQKSLAY